MKKILALFLLTFIEVSQAAGVFSNLIDPATGLIDADRLTEKYKVAPQGFTPSEGQEVKTILFDGDNKVTVTLKDGSKKVFERDVFHPERGWKQTY
ncbi:hypothetical protein [Parasutterella sp.]|uniref:hypothetical protein n=1 Tax=Parasutterella sp. TaxID=2049037 RepID=UPI003521C418